MPNVRELGAVVLAERTSGHSQHEVTPNIQPSHHLASNMLTRAHAYAKMMFCMTELLQL